MLIKMNLTTVTVSVKGQISIPKSVREELHIRKGEELVMIEDNGRIVLERADKVAKKLSMIDKSESFATMLASSKTLAKDWSNDADDAWNNV